MRGAVLKILGFVMSTLVAYFTLFWSFFLLAAEFIASQPASQTKGMFSTTPSGSASAFSSSTVAHTAALAAFFSIIASAFSVVGFISGTILAWRKEKREALSYDIDRTKKELEITKLRADLEKLSANRGAETSVSSVPFSDSGDFAEPDLASDTLLRCGSRGENHAGEAPNTGPQADGSATAQAPSR